MLVRFPSPLLLSINEANEDHGIRQTSKHIANGQRIPKDELLGSR